VKLVKGSLKLKISLLCKISTHVNFLYIHSLYVALFLFYLFIF
jgi:hypothetical protein